MPKIDKSTISSKEKIVEKFKKITKHENILSTHEELKPYETDALSAYKEKPLIVVLPENTNSESIEKYFSGTNLSEKESTIYYLALNNKYLEVKSLSRNGLVSENPPTPNKKEQMFQVHKINNNENDENL